LVHSEVELIVLDKGVKPVDPFSTLVVIAVVIKGIEVIELVLLLIRIPLSVSSIIIASRAEHLVEAGLPL